MSEALGFVVLNYVNYDETFRCVESILALPERCPVIVVDNASPNDSFLQLQQRFADDDQITVLQSGRNGGYSAGNNVGILALRQRGIQNIVIATSDTRIESPDLAQRCLAARDAGIAVVGPYVRGDEPGSQNPILWQLSLQYIAAVHLGKLWTAMKNIAFKTIPGRRREPAAAPELSSMQDVYMVHGCFLFMSDHYLRLYPQLDEALFMYGEEDLIAFNCIRSQLRVVYDPLMKVYHGLSKSTSSGDFRRRTVVTSMAILRRKMGIGALIHAYIRSH